MSFTVPLYVSFMGEQGSDLCGKRHEFLRSVYIVKAGLAEALGSCQSNISVEIKKQKNESEKALSLVESLKRSSELQFRFKGKNVNTKLNF